MAVNDTSNDAALARILQERMVTQNYGGSHGSPPPAVAPPVQQPPSNIVYVHESPSTYMHASQGSFTSPPVQQQQPQVTHVLRQGSVPPPQLDSSLTPEMHSQLQSQYAQMAPKPREETTGDAQLAETLQRMELEDANRQRRSVPRARSNPSYPQVHHHHHQTHQPQQQQAYPGTYPPNQPHPQYNSQRREIPYGTMPHRDRVRPAKSDGCGGSCTLM